MKNAFSFATRVYPTDNRLCCDRMVRTADGKFYLIKESTQPGDREAVMPYSLSQTCLTGMVLNRGRLSAR